MWKNCKDLPFRIKISGNTVNMFKTRATPHTLDLDEIYPAMASFAVGLPVHEGDEDGDDVLIFAGETVRLPDARMHASTHTHTHTHTHTLVAFAVGFVVGFAV